MSLYKLEIYATYLISAVWFVNGFYSKVLNLVPRHQAIVGHILHPDYARILTAVIGAGEICLAIWILTRKHQKLTTYFQISLIMVMNLIEFTFASHLLLWGRWNMVFASLFCLFLYGKQTFLTAKLS